MIKNTMMTQKDTMAAKEEESGKESPVILRTSRRIAEKKERKIDEEE